MMTTDEQRIAIAEWMGELEPINCHPSIEQLEAILADKDKKVVVSIKPTGEVRAIKDYANDLNPLHKAERKIGHGDWQKYLDNLQTIVCRDADEPKNNDQETLFDMIAASGPQRLEALCRTLWLERFEQ